jgi:hypothetical protein
VGLKSLKSLNLTNGYPNNKNKNNKNNNNNNKVKSKPLELRSRVKKGSTTPVKRNSVSRSETVQNWLFTPRSLKLKATLHWPQSVLGWVTIFRDGWRYNREARIQGMHILPDSYH